jgi:hypothetical protein
MQGTPFPPPCESCWCACAATACRYRPDRRTHARMHTHTYTHTHTCRVGSLTMHSITKGSAQWPHARCCPPARNSTCRKRTDCRVKDAYKLGKTLGTGGATQLRVHGALAVRMRSMPFTHTHTYTHTHIHTYTHTHTRTNTLSATHTQTLAPPQALRSSSSPRTGGPASSTRSRS